VTFAHPLSAWAIAPTFAALALIAWAAYRRAPLSAGRRLTLSTLRFLTLAWLGICLMRPVSRAVDAASRDAFVPILIDASRSMGIADAGRDTRIASARQIVARSVLPAIGSSFRTEVIRFGDHARPADLQTIGASDARTSIASALRDIRERNRGRPVAGIVLVSDGGDNGGDDPGEEAAGGPPVFTIGVGSPAAPRDREVVSVTATDSVLDGTSADISASAVAHGYGAAPIELRLLENGRPVDVRRIVPIADGAPVSATFTAAPASKGPTVFTVEIPRAADDLVPENDARSVLVPPARPPARVLFVEGAPGFEHAFLRRAWGTDQGLEVDSVLRKGKTDGGQNTFYVQAPRPRGDALLGGFPATREALFAYDVVVLANVDADDLTNAQLEEARAFVGERGGGLLVLGARAFQRHTMAGTPLEDVLPLDLSDRSDGVVKAVDAPPMNRTALTRAGAEHPIMQLAASADDNAKRWAAIPALAAISPLGAARPGASVLAVTAGPGGTVRALVAVERYGKGRSMVFTGEASWRWRMMLPAADHTYDRFWRQSVRWLAQNTTDPVAVTAPVVQAPNAPIPIRVEARDAQFRPLDDATVNVRAVSSDGRTSAVTAERSLTQSGLYEADVPASAAGVYRITADVTRGGESVGSAESYVLVGGVDVEMADPRLNDRLLERIARRSGGAVVDTAHPAALVAALRAHAPAAALALRHDLWSTGWSFAVIVGLLGGEWIVRRRWGLR
jgi:uncharacterized membrane protein